jgi:outer membrane protein insertion porin family
MAFLLVLALLAWPAEAPDARNQAQGVSSYVGKAIVAAEVVIEGFRTEDATVRSLIETNAGEPLAMAEVRETIAHLFSLGRYQDIQVEAFAEGDGIRLRYNLIPLHSVQRVEFRGALGLSSGTLREAVTERFGATPSATRATEVAQRLQEVYNERGYLGAAIRPVVEVLHDPDRTILAFEIEPGPVARIGQVTIEGDPGEPRDPFLRRIHADPGRVYERIEIDERLADFIQRQRREGRYEAAARHTFQQSDDGKTVNLTIDVDRGPAATVQFTGDPLPKDRLEELVPVRREGSVDADLIEDSERRIANFLHQQGYWKASVTSTRQQTAERLDIVFNVRRGLQYRIDDGVEVAGNQTISIEELRPALVRLAAGELFVESDLSAAVGAIRGIYLRRGFAHSKISSSANERPPAANGEGRVKPVITIVEGPLTLVGPVSFSGNEAVPTEALATRIASATGRPYFEPTVVQDRDAILLEYRNRGFATATVEVSAQLAEDRSRVDLTFRITEGPQTLVDHVLIVGNVRTDPKVIAREIVLQPGQPLGLADLIESRRRVAALGLFRRVQITEITHAGSTKHDVLVTVEEAPSTTVGYGGGVEASRRLQEASGTGTAEEQLEVAPRGFFEIGRRNLGGRNRSVNLFTRLSLRPDSSADSASGDDDLFGFAEYRVIGTYREPRSFGLNSDIIITGAVEQGIRSSFNFARKGVNAEVLRRLSPRMRLSGRYSFNTTRIFDVTFDTETDEGKIGTIDRIFPQVRLSGFSAAISRDTRDDVVDPARGRFLSAEGSIAARSLGGQVGFVKSYVQGLFFHRLPVGRRLVFAGRVAVGLADGFPRLVERTDTAGNPIEGEFITLEDLPASERFFAGGDSTIRGFALDSVGTPRTITQTGFPRGGNALLLLNGELRLPVWGDLGAAFFVDGGNVFERTTQLDLGELRGSVGFGVRYRSPIGPVRLDLGFKLDRRTVGERVEGPRGIHFSIGHAF